MITNEEKRAKIYVANGDPTQSDQVTSATSIEEFNLNWKEADLPQKQRTKHVHGIHPYLGKFVPQIVEIFLRKYFKEGETVLDPFCGSGTTLVQANELGINSIGFDISAFNVLLTRVKTGRYDLPVLRNEVMDILEKTENAIREGPVQLRLLEERAKYHAVTETDNQYLRDWFSDQALIELLTYRDLIHSEGYQYKELLSIILTRSARSARLTTHFDLDFPKEPQNEDYWCYKHSRTCSPVQEAYKFLRRYSINSLKRIEEFSEIRTRADVKAIHEDSKVTDISPVDGVITSPPYVGLIDYHKQHEYAYHLLGLVDKSEMEIGSASNGSSKVAKSNYQNDLIKVFSNLRKFLKDDGKVIVIAGDKHNLYDEIADKSGFRVEGIVQRHVNRRTGRRSNDFFESVFIWQKN